MRRNELDSIPELWPRGASVHIDIAELVTAPSIAGTGKIRGLWSITAIGGESFQAGINGNKPFVIRADHGGEHHQGMAEVQPDPPVVEIHKNVRTGLQFGDFGESDVDIPRARASSRQNLRREPC